MPVNPTRHLSVFSPHAFGNRRVDIIGVGATGSHILVELAKLGITNLHVWDPDVVAEENISNQMYGPQHIGQLKVEAARTIVHTLTGTTITTHPEAVDGSQVLGDVVFVLTDGMTSRKQIWERALRYQMRTSLVIETRMGAEEGRVYAVDPSNPTHVDAYEATLYDDAKVTEASACGTSISVGPTAAILAGFAVWQLLRWFAVETGASTDILEQEIIFALRPSNIFAYPFTETVEVS